MSVLTAHGVRYSSVASAQQMLAHLRSENEKFGSSDGRVTEINAIEAALAEHDEREVARAKAAERPYVVLYRKAVGPDKIFKGRRTFRTAAEQSRWISEAPDDVAITFYTN